MVSSNNENGGGIILALNDKAKALGLKRGNPLFQVKGLISLNKVQVCVADHKKYKEISAQIMAAVQEQGIVLDFVQYSIDEFFGTLPIEDTDSVRHYVRMVKEMIGKVTGIPVSCGCSQTYTLAKVATHFAKRYKAYNGICVLQEAQREKALLMLPIGDVWGVGRRSRAKMEQLHVTTALDFVNKEESEVRKCFNTAGLRTYRELKGIPSISLSKNDMQQSIMQSRTFAYMTTEKRTLENEIRMFVNDCCAKLRAQGSVCRTVTVFINTNRHRDDLPQYSNSATGKLQDHTSDTPVIMKCAQGLLDKLFRPNYQYKRAGVVLGDIKPTEGSQLDMFAVKENERRNKLMKVADEINNRFGAHSVWFDAGSL